MLAPYESCFAYTVFGHETRAVRFKQNIRIKTSGYPNILFLLQCKVGPQKYGLLTRAHFDAEA